MVYSKFMKSVADFLDPEFVDFLRKMPPEIWVMKMQLDFLEFWYDEMVYLAENDMDAEFLPPGQLPKKKQPISQDELVEFTKFIKNYRGGLDNLGK